MTIEYERAYDRTVVERTVDPVGLVAKGSIWYLVAAVDGAPRTYRASRIRRADVLDVPSDRPADLDLAAYWAEARESFQAALPSIDWEMRCSPRVIDRVRLGWRFARLVDEDPPGPDGWVTGRFRADSIEVAVECALGLGADGEVLDPPDIAARVLTGAEARRGPRGTTRRLADMSLYDVAAPGSPGDPGELVAPTLVAAFDGWVDAGSAATTALAQLLDGAPTVVRFDADQLFDYRARRPTLRIVDGRLSELTWPELAISSPASATATCSSWPAPSRTIAGRPSARPWSSSPDASASRSGSAWAASRPPSRIRAPCRSSAPTSQPGRLRGDVQAGPSGTLRVPAAVVSVLEMAMAEGGIPAVGYFAQVPHYVSGAYPAASVALLSALGRHLGDDPAVRRPGRGGAPAAQPSRLRGGARRARPASTSSGSSRWSTRSELPVGRRPHHRDRALPARGRHRGQPAQLSRRYMTHPVRYGAILGGCVPAASSTCCCCSRAAAA